MGSRRFALGLLVIAAVASMGAQYRTTNFVVNAQDAQIAPVATLIVKLSTEPDLFRLAVSRFAQDLSNLNSTYLPYLQSLDGATDALVTLGNRATAIRVPSDSLWRGFATYNRNALAGVRCTEMPSDVVTEKLKKIQTKMAALNLPLESAEDIAALSEIKPKRLDDTKSPYVPFYANSNSPWYAMGLEYQNLRFGPESTRRRFVGKPRPDGLTSFLSLDERKSPEWDERASKHLRQIEAYAKHNDDEAIESFVKVCDLYSAIIAILPNSSTSFPSALSSFVAYLSASPVAKEQPLIWLVKVKLFLRRGTLDEHEQGYERVRAAIRQGGGQLLNTVLDVDRFNPIRGNSNMSTLVDP